MAATLAKRPEDRPATPGELAARLAPFCVGQPSVPPTVQPQPGDEFIPTKVEGLPPPLTLPEGPGRPLPWAWVAGLVGVALVVGLAFWAFRPPGGGEDEDDPEKEKPTFEIARLPEERRRPWHPPELVTVLGDDRWRHWGSVSAVAVDGAGKRVVSRGQDGHVRLWDAASGKQLAALLSLPHAGKGLAVSTSGEAVAAGSEYGVVWVWRGPEWEQQRLVRHKGDVLAVAFRPNSHTLASAGADGVVRWGEATEKAKLSECARPVGVKVLALLWGEDGRLVAGDDKGDIHLIDTASGKLERTINTKHDVVLSLAFGPAGRLVSAHMDGHVCQWQLKDGKHLTDFPQHFSFATGVAFSPDGKWLASAGWDEHFILSNANTGKKVADVSTGPHRLNGLAWLPGASPTLFIASDEGRIVAWSPTSREFLREEVGHYGRVAALAWLPSGELASIAAGPEVRAWSLATGKCRSFPSGLSGGGASLAVCNGELVVGGIGGAVNLLAPATGEKRGEMHVDDWAYTLSPLSGGRLLIGGKFPRAEVWDIRERKRLDQLPAHTGECWVSAAEGDRIATGDGSWKNDGTVRLFGPDLRPAGTYGGHLRGVSALAMRSGRVLSGDHGGTIYLDGKPLGKQLSSQVAALLWSEDCRHFAASSEAGEVEWRDADGERVAGWKFPGAVKSLALTADGRHLLTGNADGTIFALKLP
jgi:WD40 repeat protein